ncbi:G protein signaling regulator like protein [Venturia nashicola]|uniref:G protein signaling regulator like protein n=1 Tax=Venturia nashicola TaxID=86259 RepID=A0A4Z1PCI1_9PEZI|nr:G protein signaling regulator like protein [Venturia nashicola]TLD29984.1 G protein signaling regulator like protein [Venturia nashicola]
MVYSLKYTRPHHVPPPTRNSTETETTESITDSVDSGSTAPSNGIPEALSFDRIISGGTCPPVTIRDFMDFLKYIEHSAENLQFYMWFRDYIKRFEDLPASEKALSPEWTQAQEEADAMKIRNAAKEKPLAVVANTILRSQDLEPAATSSHSEVRNPFGDSHAAISEKASLESMGRPHTGIAGTIGFGTVRTTYTAEASTAFEEAGCKFQPFTIQPFREEISRIISIYVVDGGPRQLNLSARERTALLHALDATTNPSAFRNVLKTIEYTLRRQAHPNFIRWSICNGNGARVIFARGLGVSLILVGIIVGILITLSNAGRGWRVIALIPLLLGISTLMAAWSGMCVVLHGMHHRHLRPWELFEDPEGPRYSEESVTGEKRSVSMDSFSTGRNSYEDEPWVASYEKRNLVRKVFDREMWIEEPSLRQIQDTIFVQSLIGAVVISAVLVGIFCAVPHGHLY